MSRVDVIVPCYKYAHFLPQCVQSVLSQVGVDVRVLIIDDCSPDDSAGVATALAAKDHRIEFRRHAVNRGHIATYNEGLTWLDAEYGLLLSADDLLTPGSLCRATELMNSDGEIGFVYGKRILWCGNDAPPVNTFVERRGSPRVVPGAQFIEQLCTSMLNPVCTPTAIVRTRIQRAVGPYREELPHTGDFEMWLRFAALGSVGILDTDQAYWRSHGQNMRELYRGPSDFRQQERAIENLFAEHAHRIPESDRLHRAARHRLSEMALWEAHKRFESGQVDACREHIDLASEFNPQIVSSPIWRRLRVKRAMGTGVWSVVCRGRAALRSIFTRSATPVPDQTASRWQA